MNPNPSTYDKGRVQIEDSGLTAAPLSWRLTATSVRVREVKTIEPLPKHIICLKVIKMCSPRQPLMRLWDGGGAVRCQLSWTGGAVAAGEWFPHVADVRAAVVLEHSPYLRLSRGQRRLWRHLCSGGVQQASAEPSPSAYGANTKGSPSLEAWAVTHVSVCDQKLLQAPDKDRRRWQTRRHHHLQQEPCCSPAQRRR